MKKHLTQSDFENIPPCPADKHRIEYCDTTVPGLYLEVRATSPYQGTLYLRYKNAAGRPAQEARYDPGIDAKTGPRTRQAVEGKNRSRRRSAG